ncbi:permease prefix domain 1-containing protein [Anaerovorax odorimutans]|uniref:permease prefix domain 1-containing protein n=1 Tax=Anaerovorax odorimutans TaxID=109327 RepID=UPI00210B39AF|nr:permease prefix domain 1-containing protein [Anaerovorax odorimutans]
MVWPKKKEGSHRDDFLNDVLKQIHFIWDRAAIKKELEAHIEDAAWELRAQGVEAEKAQQQAVAAMGNAEEIGKALNRQHHFWLGWLWLISTAVTAVLIFVCIGFSLGGINQLVSAADSAEKEVKAEYSQQNISCVTQKIDKTIDADGYQVTIEKLIRGTGKDQSGCLIVSVKKDLFGGEFFDISGLKATAGKEEFSQSLGEQNSSMRVIWQRQGFNYRRIGLSLNPIPRDAESMHLSFDRYGRSWDVDIPLKEGGDA